MSLLQPYTLKRIGLAWAAAFTLEMVRRGVEPATGPGDIIFLPLLSAFISVPVMLAVLFLGLLLFIPQLNRAWYRHRWMFWALFLTGCVLYIGGVYAAHHAHFTLHEHFDVANGYLVHWALPGGLCVVFALCFTPLERSVPAVVEAVQRPIPTASEGNNLDRYLRKRGTEKLAM